MLKLIFNKDVNFKKKKKKINEPKMETLRMARYIQILCLSTLNLINQRNASHIILSNMRFHLEFSGHKTTKLLDGRKCSHFLANYN